MNKSDLIKEAMVNDNLQMIFDKCRKEADGREAQEEVPAAAS